ncbi:MAG TPA: S8 family serine peptidase [Rubrobacteraceae bacterium]|nr:S8 family serine peptidase [Rubrobacteraceae bacterium]
MFSQDLTPEDPAPGTTGRYIVLFSEENGGRSGADALSDTAGLSAISTADFEEGAVEGERLESLEAVVFDELSVAVVDAAPSQAQALSAATTQEESPILAVEPERVVYALLPERFGDSLTPAPNPLSTTAGPSPEFLRGYREAVSHLVGRVLGDGGASGAATEEVAATAFDESEFTWGLQATKSSASRFSGRGVRVAVLDTGLDLQHPDFQRRSITSRSFIMGEEVQDGHGHGTHCIGTACGPRQPGQSPRYGIAYTSEIFVGKVLSNRGSGTDGGILAGINWAISNGCRVISMSLGAATRPGQGFSPIFEAVARRALAAGTLIIAAAGNESNRPQVVAPVGHPANCPSIMAVAALDAQGQVAFFSCGSVNHPGGGVDIAGPGVSVRSSWPRPIVYRAINGTSMATPHVAGIAALHAEANPGVRGRALGQVLFESARRQTLLSTDVGVGLVQAP